MATTLNMDTRCLDNSARCFAHPEIVETSVGPMHLLFTAAEPDDPPMVNVLDLYHSQPHKNFPAALIPEEKPKVGVWATFELTDSGWRSQGERITVEGQEKPLWPELHKELADHVACWMSNNQDRYVEYQRSEAYGSLEACGAMLDEQAAHLLQPKGIDEVMTPSWAKLVDPAVLELGREASKAVAKIHAAIEAAQEVFEAIAEANPYALHSDAGE